MSRLHERVLRGEPTAIKLVLLEMRHAIPSFLVSLVFAACATGAGPLGYSNLPANGKQIPTGVELVQCDSRQGARYMARTGFYHPDCATLEITAETSWRVTLREYEDLGEGGLWLLQAVSSSGQTTWLLFPWHDWV